MSHDLDGDPIRYPGLSVQHRLQPNGPFGVATMLVLGGVASRFQPGQVLSAITELVSEGKTLDGAEPAGYEIGQWKHRFMCDEEPESEVPEDAYFAWVSPMFWDYDPPLVIYSKAEFMTLFEDCCRNFVAAHPERRDEFAAALAVNGMSLLSTADRP